MRQKIKSWILPISIIGGCINHEWIDYLTPLSLVLLFCMLTITYCRINPRDLKFDKLHFIMLAAQMSMAAVTYLLLIFFDRTVAAGLFMCVFIPTATAAPIVTGLLGGNIVRVATYSLLCNLIVALTGPAIFAAIGDNNDISFIDSFLKICSKVIPLLIAPMIVAFSLRKFWKKAHTNIANHQSLSFYLWAVALFIVIGSSVSFIISRFTWEIAPIIIYLIIGSAIVCIIQFYVGKKIGNRYAEPISVAQSLAQKNTILAIWITLTFLDPITSIAPAAYMAWHNLFNSWQLMHKKN